MICRTQRRDIFNHMFGKSQNRPKSRSHSVLSGWIESLERRDVPAVIQWTGTAGTNLWSDTSNWSGGVLPGQNDEVVIPTSGDAQTAQNPIIIQSSVVIENINSARPISMSGADASLRLTSGNSTLSDGLNINNYAGLSVQGASTSLTIDGPSSDPTQGQVMALGGAQIKWDGIQTLDNSVLFINPTSSISMPDLVTIKNISELTNMTGTFSAPQLTSMTLSRLSLYNGGTYDIPQLADASMTLVEVNGAASKMNLPGLKKFDGGRFRLDSGATLTADNLQVVNIGPATAWAFSWFVGQDSSLNLPKLVYVNALPQPSPNEAPDARIQLRGNGQINWDPSKWTMTNGLVTFSFMGNSKLNGSVVLGSNSVLTGSGTITGSLDNFGRISPSGDTSQYGTFNVTGDWTNRPGSVVDLQMGGPDKLDRLNIGGQATILGGDLKIAFTDGFSNDPQLLPVGQYQLITWSEWAGQFTTSPSLVPRSDGIQITAQAQYQPGGLVETLALFNTNPDIISVSDMSFPEGNDPVSYGLFTIHRSGPMTVPLTINYQVIPGSAKSGTDYNFPGGPITLAPGESERQIRFIIRGNNAYSGDKSFQVQLTSVSERGKLGQSTATVTIKEDDAAPQIITPKPVPVQPAPKSELSAAARQAAALALQNAKTKKIPTPKNLRNRAIRTVAKPIHKEIRRLGSGRRG